MGAPSNDPGDMAAELLQARVIQQEEELQELQQEVDQAMLDLEDWHARRDQQRPRQNSTPCEIWRVQTGDSSND